MRRIFIVIILLLFVGCNGVTLSPAYDSLLDQSVALSQKYADDSESMSKEQCIQALKIQAGWWKHFQAGRDGVIYDGD
tara:strand:- start:827 stop:1060 length:234 start_codon:yes stop_codon:yes gene_type:complete